MKLTYLRAWCLALPLAVVLCTSATMAHGAVIVRHSADAEIRSDNTLINAGEPSLRVGRVPGGAFNGQHVNAIFVFDLEGVGVIESATLEFFLESMTGNAQLPDFNVDLWGVGYSKSASGFHATATYNEIGLDSSLNTLIETNFASPSNVPNNFLSTTEDEALVTYLNNRADNDFVFFRLSQSTESKGSNKFYTFTSADGESGQSPQLTLTTTAEGPNQVVTPEPASVAIWGVLLLVGFCFWRRQAIRMRFAR